jgi:hypothetical protein
MSADEATLTLNAVIGGVTYTEVVAITKVKTGPEIVSSLPVANLFNGREVYLTTDQKRYIYKSGTGWDRKFDGADLITNSVGTNSLDAGSVTAAKLAATNVITLSAQIANALIETGHIKNLAVETLKIGPNAVTVPAAVEGASVPISGTTTGIQTVSLTSLTVDFSGDPESSATVFFAVSTTLACVGRNCPVTIMLYEDGVAKKGWNFNVPNSSVATQDSRTQFINFVPAAGTHTYEVKGLYGHYDPGGTYSGNSLANIYYQETKR